jgi:hypothetical protein
VIVPSPDAQDNEAADDSSLKSTGCGGLGLQVSWWCLRLHSGRDGTLRRNQENLPPFKRRKAARRRFLHGDIRGFNTVFSENEGEGWLIDFDLAAGKYNQQLCSPEATNYLADGMRCENMRSVKSGTIGTHWDN